MAEAIRRVPFDEFVDHLEEYFVSVVHNRETVEVERKEGEVVVLKPARAESRRSSRQRGRRDRHGRA